MIVRRRWYLIHEGLKVAQCEGLYLFGFIPLYVWDLWSERTKHG